MKPNHRGNPPKEDSGLFGRIFLELNKLRGTLEKMSQKVKQAGTELNQAQACFPATG